MEISIQKVIEWLSEHDTAWDDFCNKFGIYESLKEKSCVELLFEKEKVLLLKEEQD